MRFNVRDSGNVKAKKIGSLKKNSKVEILENKKDWFKIKFEKSYGWVFEKYIKIQK
ncbi:SH3 domain-containing protein [Lederbergia wuyishanensis]|uniref:SH3 domain-containing protein n=1 Tax=Lederbergia wuyishanensis TaxID=1347903 RepID=UPI003520BC97